MPPTQQRLRTDHRRVREPNLRLETKLELVLGEGPSQIDVEAAPRLRLRAQDRHEKAADTAAVRLRLIECKVGVRDQLVDVGAVVGSNGDAYARVDVQDVVVDGVRLRQALEHGLDDFAD